MFYWYGYFNGTHIGMLCCDLPRSASGSGGFSYVCILWPVEDGLCSGGSGGAVRGGFTVRYVSVSAVG